MMQMPPKKVDLWEFIAHSNHAAENGTLRLLADDMPVHITHAAGETVAQVTTKVREIEPKVPLLKRTVQQFEMLEKHEQANIAMWILGTALSGIFTAASASHIIEHPVASMVDADAGSNTTKSSRAHVNWSQAGVFIFQAGLTALSAYMTVAALQGSTIHAR